MTVETDLMNLKQQKRLRAKNTALALVLAGLVFLFYAITVVRMGGQ